MSQKRKNASQEAETPNKKQQTGKKVKVRFSAGPDIAKPVIATAPSAVLPPMLKFASYSQKADSSSPHLLLHSSDHDTIDYTAVDARKTHSNEQHLKHYVAVFDPATGRLEVTEARKMTVKGTPKQYQQEPESEEDVPAPAYSSRVALTEAFGSKKSKKAVATMAENRLLAGCASEDDPLTRAILSTVPDEPEASIEDADSARTNKPLPPPNLAASDVRDAYPLSTLIVPQPAAATLSSMPTGHWNI